jgi:elongation factor G
MKKYESKDIRNVALVGHGKSGKTSLSEAFLFNGKVTDRLGRVDGGDSVMDFDPEERARQLTINTSFHHLSWKKCMINIIDTPGDANFIADTYNSLQIADGALVIVDASSGVQVITEKVWQYLNEFKIPRIIVINKLDRENTDFYNTLENIKKTLRIKPLVMFIPIGKEAGFKGVVDLVKMKGYVFADDSSGNFSENEIPADCKDSATELRQKLIEDIAETKEELLEKYLDGQELSSEEIAGGIKTGIINQSLIPVICGSAMQNTGIKMIMDTMADYLPSPLERAAIEVIEPKTKEQKTIEPKNDAPLAAYVFKTIADPYAGKLTIFRVFAGTLNADSTLYNAAQKAKEKIGQILQLEGKTQKPAESAITGDIMALAKLKESTTGDTYCDEKNEINFKRIKFPSPVISCALFPKSRGDEDKMSNALARLVEEDPSLILKREDQTKEFILSGMGQIHLDVTIEKLKRKFGVEVETSIPKIPYKETIKGKTKIQGKYKKQSGGRGQYGDCWLEIEPLPRSGGFEFVDKIFGGAIPKNYVPSVEKGVVEAMHEGVLAGYPIVDLKVLVVDGSYHDVDSSDMAFKIAASMGFKKGFMECNPILLEPIMNVEVNVPEDMTGDIIGDLNSRRGRVLGMDQGVGGQVVKAKVPKAEMLRYASDLTSITSGRGMFTMEFDHYEEVPAHLSEKIIAAAKTEK